MSILESPVKVVRSDLATARDILIDEIDRLNDVVQELEVRLKQVVTPAAEASAKCAGEEAPPPRSILADEIFNRSARVKLITDRLITLRNSIDL